MSAYEALRRRPTTSASCSASSARAGRPTQQAQKKVVALGRDKKQQDAADISDGLASMAFDETVGALDALSKFNFEGGQTAAEHVDEVYKQARTLVVLGCSALTLVLGFVLAWAITRQLLAPARRRAAARRPRWRAPWPKAT